MFRGPLIFIICDLLYSEKLSLIGMFFGITPFLSLANVGFESLLYKNYNFNLQEFKKLGILRSFVILAFSTILFSSEFENFIQLNFLLPFILDTLYSIYYVNNNVTKQILKNIIVSITRTIIYVSALLLSLSVRDFNYLVLLDIVIVFYVLYKSRSEGTSKLRWVDVKHLVILLFLGFLSSFLLRYDLNGIGKNNSNFIRLIIYLGYCSTLLQEFTQFFLIFKTRSKNTSFKKISVFFFFLSLLFIPVNSYVSIGLSFIAWRFIFSEFIADYTKYGEFNFATLLFILPLIITYSSNALNIPFDYLVYFRSLTSLLMISIIFYLQKRLIHD